MRKNSNIELLVTDGRLEDVMGDIARFNKAHRTFEGNLVRAGRVIVLKANGKTARVVARGASDLPKNEISLISETRDRLGIRAGQRVNFTFVRASVLDEFLWSWDATNATDRVAARLAILSLGLGLLGAALGTLSLLG